jgi:hypothetical protein
MNSTVHDADRRANTRIRVMLARSPFQIGQTRTALYAPKASENPCHHDGGGWWQAGQRGGTMPISTARQYQRPKRRPVHEQCFTQMFERRRGMTPSSAKPNTIKNSEITNLQATQLLERPGTVFESSKSSQIMSPDTFL